MMQTIVLQRNLGSNLRYQKGFSCCEENLPIFELHSISKDKLTLEMDRYVKLIPSKLIIIESLISHLVYS